MPFVVAEDRTPRTKLPLPAVLPRPNTEALSLVADELAPTTVELLPVMVAPAPIAVHGAPAEEAPAPITVVLVLWLPGR
jgi:hypothetical protein